MKTFQVIKFLQDHSIDFNTEGHPRCSKGWVQLKHCPFCGADDYHLGINLSNGYANCWKCRGKNIFQVIQKLLKCDWNKANKLYSQYEGKRSKIIYREASHKKETKLPHGCAALTSRHKKYLIGRNFDPDYLEHVYGLQGTSHVGDYKFRIIASIYKNGKRISYQGRDITGKSRLRYKACPKEQEAEEHQNNLYGFDMVPKTNVVVVEGITDCWRLGPGSLGTFGIAYTPSQVQLLTNFTNVFILFDNSHIAQKMAKKLAWEVNSCGVHTEIITIDENDPAELSQTDAEQLMSQLCI